MLAWMQLFVWARWHVRALFRQLEKQYHQEPWPSDVLPRVNPLILADAIISRLHSSAALSQTGRAHASTHLALNGTLRGGQALVDLFVLTRGANGNIKEVNHHPEVPEPYIRSLTGPRPFLALAFAYDAPDSGQSIGNWNPLRSQPVIYYYKDNMNLWSTHHQIGPSEDGKFKSASNHIQPLVNWLRGVLKS